MSTQSGKYRNEPESCSSISNNNNQKMKQLQEYDEKQRENESKALTATSCGKAETTRAPSSLSQLPKDARRTNDEMWRKKDAGCAGFLEERLKHAAAFNFVKCVGSTCEQKIHGELS